LHYADNAYFGEAERNYDAFRDNFIRERRESQRDGKILSEEKGREVNVRNSFCTLTYAA